MDILTGVATFFSVQAGLGLVLLPLLVIPIARKNGLNVWKWGILTYFFNIFALIFLYRTIGKKVFSYFLILVSILLVGMVLYNQFYVS